MTAAFCCTVAAAMRADSAADNHFQERVKPLLDLKCVSCHGPEKVKGSLRLDSREGVLKGGESGPSIVPGKPAESLLLQSVLHSKKDLEMPPKEKLSAKEISILERWIADGVPWPKVKLGAAAAPMAVGERVGDAWHDRRNPIVRIFGGQRLDLWSLKPIRSVEPPGSSAPSIAVRSPIDRFILEKLHGRGLKQSPEADRRTIIRRLSFDLTGLPPTDGEVAAFIQDRSPDAYDRLVDRLLNSPRYGEHQARLWLDVVRYSDSNGFDWDEFRPRAWRFRDYVIRSFNADKPFDQFVREQLAGDELLDGPPRNAAEQDDLIATGYLRLGPHDSAAPLFNEQDRSRAELMSDLVETTSSAFLGLTMGCCRCHDHKYDPLSQADHYRMRAFFEAVKFADDLPTDDAPHQELIRHHNEIIDAQIEPLEKQRDDARGIVRKRLQEKRRDALTAEEKTLLELPKESHTEAVRIQLEKLEEKIRVPDNEIVAALGKTEKEQLDQLEKQIGALKKQRQKYSYGLLMTDANTPPPVTRILFQGNHKMEREPVSPGFISALDPNPAQLHRAANSKTTGRRLTLADWITSTTNPLTSRVFVNRIWQQHFGRGLVGTPNDFGLSGLQPTHPELMDWLATEFQRNGWSVKRLHRQIVTSATYRQTAFPVADQMREGSARDTDNTLYWRQNARRLSAEQLRDSLLATAGSLEFKPGGAPIWPDLDPEILQANPAFLDDNETRTKGWYPSPKSEQFVRSVFLIQKRTVRVPFMETFDLPENSSSCPRRTVSIVAPQALSLLNSPLAVEATKAFAERIQGETSGGLAEQVRHAFSVALQRAPNADELVLCMALAKKRSFPELCRALLNLNEFAYVD